MLALILEIIALVLGIAIIVRVWRASALDGVLCFFLPFWTIVALIKYWREPEHDIKYLMLGQILLMAAAGGILVHADRQQQARELLAQQQAGEDDAEDAPGAGRASPAQQSRGARTAAKAPVRSTEPDTPARAPTPEELAPPNLRQALHNATFLRGAMERSLMGFQLQIPDHFHALSASDARRIEASLRQPPDAHLVGWIAHESVALDAPDAWHVTARWHNDGWVGGGGDPLDPWPLLQAAQHAGGTRLAGSGGDLIGYTVAPSSFDGVIDWVEERLPAQASASVLDCHALRLGRRGVLEFTVSGQPIGSQQLCNATVKLLARQAKLDPGAEYSSAPPDGLKAPYTLRELVAGAP